jgi:glycosyltransferase involved in cell wall biosynthesis
LIPCYNEERSIGEVLARFPLDLWRSYGYDVEIIVIDNASTDKTGEIARSLGATVLYEPRKGKGNAMLRGFKYISEDVDYVVMLDGDNTYRPEELLRLVELLESDFCNVSIGSRLAGHIHDGSMAYINRVGNWFFSHLVRTVYRVNVTDVLTGYFAWKRESLAHLCPHLTSEGFAIEMEMITKMARLGERIYSVPISYHVRSGSSSLRPFRDGIRILMVFIRNVLWRPNAAPTMRIAFVSDAVMPWHNGGKERRLYEISKRLSSEKREVHIYTMKWWDEPQSVIVRDGIYFHALTQLMPLYRNGRRSIHQALVFGLATCKLLFARFDILDVDHIPFFPLFSARLVTWLRGKKLFATWHEVWGKAYWFEYLRGYLGIFGFMVESISLGLPDVFISNSEHTTRLLRAAGVTAMIETIPLGVDFESVYSAPISVELSDVIFVGRLLSHKNASMLVHALSLVKNTFPAISALIVGDGPERSRVERMIDELDLRGNIRLIERVENTLDLYGLMKASRMLVLPSVREGFGLVTIEANAAGIPVITTDHVNNAAKDFIRHGENGYVTDATAESIAFKICEILRSPHSLKPTIDIERHGWLPVIRNLERVFAT